MTSLTVSAYTTAYVCENEHVDATGGLLGEFSQGSLKLPDVSELARGVQPGAGQAHASWPKAPSPRTLCHVAVVVDGEVMSASVHS